MSWFLKIHILQFMTRNNCCCICEARKFEMDNIVRETRCLYNTYFAFLNNIFYNTCEGALHPSFQESLFLVLVLLTQYKERWRYFGVHCSQDAWIYRHRKAIKGSRETALGIGTGMKNVFSNFKRNAHHFSAWESRSTGNNFQSPWGMKDTSGKMPILGIGVYCIQ